MRRFACLLSVVLATGTLCAAAGRAAREQTPLQIGSVVPELLLRNLVGSTVEA